MPFGSNPSSARRKAISALLWSIPSDQGERDALAAARTLTS